VDLFLVIRQRLKDLGLEQRDLATAAQVTESYISQLLTRKKAPPAPYRTDIYEKMEKLLKLPKGELARLAELERQEDLKKKLGDPPGPLFEEVRELLLRKCKPERATQMRTIFEKQPFGELERLITQKLLDLVKGVARKELANEKWLRFVARANGRSFEQIRVISLEFLDTDVFSVSIDNCVTFMDPLIESWDCDLATFGMEVILNQKVVPGQPKRFEFIELEPAPPILDDEPGLKKFLLDPALSRDATEGEIEFLRKLRFKEKRPTALYFYREVQNLRDPLHFRKS